MTQVVRYFDDHATSVSLCEDAISGVSIHPGKCRFVEMEAVEHKRGSVHVTEYG